jgi:starvation-inducible DNA-binding protein
MSEKVVAQLNQVLCDTYMLYSKTQNYHWNVEGENFYQIHKMLEEHYNDHFAAIDAIAEKIRMLGKKVPGTLYYYNEKSPIKDADENLSWQKMLTDLAADQATVMKSLNACLKVAQSAGDEATADLMVQRLQAHHMQKWFLESMIR